MAEKDSSIFEHHRILSKEIVENIRCMSDQRAARECHLLSQDYLSLGRQLGFIAVALKYALSQDRVLWYTHDSPYELSGILRRTLESDDKWARSVRTLKILDSRRAIPNTSDKEFYSTPYEEEGISKSEERKDHLLEELATSEGYIHHDPNLPHILQTPVNIKMLCISCRWYDFDFQLYEEHSSHAFSHILHKAPVETLCLRGVVRFELQVSNLPPNSSLRNITMASSALAKLPDTKYFVRQTNLPIPVQSFAVSNTDNGVDSLFKIFNFSDLKALTVSAVTWRDILACSLIMGSCTGTMETLELSTRFIDRDEVLHGAISWGMPLFRMRTLKHTSVKLDALARVKIDEIDWFSDNLRSMPKNPAPKQSSSR